MPPKLILASQSPRRKQLMKLAGFTFKVFNPNVKEDFNASMNVRKVPQFLACKKARASLLLLKNKNVVVVAADTIVLLKGKIYSKPIDEKEALNMLQQLNGKMHEVITGVCIMTDEKGIAFSDTTKVFFNQLTKEQLVYYVKHYHPLDKAGAYGIQDWMGVRGVEKIIGDYFNVMGLPINRVAEALKEFGIE